MAGLDQSELYRIFSCQQQVYLQIITNLCLIEQCYPFIYFINY